MPSVQPVQTPQPVPQPMPQPGVGGASVFSNQMPGAQSGGVMPGVQVNGAMPAVQPNGMATSPQTPADGKEKKPGIDKNKIITIIMGISIAAALGVAVTFIVLFVSKNNEYEELSESTQLLIEEAAVDARNEQALADAEEAKKDTRQFTGPTDYGQVSFDYPKLWSLYVEADAAKGGNYVAYFNPIEIEPVSPSTVYALRIVIQNKTYESMMAEYQKYIDRGLLSMETITLDSNTAVRYTGTIPGTDLQGVIVLIRIRDKTVLLRTDSMLFEKDFEKILASIKYNV